MQSFYKEKEPHKADCRQVEYCDGIDRACESFGCLLESYETAAPEARDAIVQQALEHKAWRIPDIPECLGRLEAIQDTDPEPCAACMHILATAGMAVGLQLMSLEERFKDSKEDKARLSPLGDKMLEILC